MEINFKIKFKYIKKHQGDSDTFVNTYFFTMSFINELCKILDLNKAIVLDIKLFSGVVVISIGITEHPYKIKNLQSKDNLDVSDLLIHYLVGLIEIKKFLRGEEIKSIENHNSQIEIVNKYGIELFPESNIFNLYINNTTIKNTLSQIFDNLQNDSFFSTYEITDRNEISLMSVKKDDFLKPSIKKEMNIMEILNYDPEIREFRFKGSETFSIAGSNNTFLYYVVHDYYPIKHFNNNVDANILKVRNLVYKFKDGKTPTGIGNLISDAIKAKGISLINTCIVVIPASTQEKTISRLMSFSNILSVKLGIANAFGAITTEDHESTKGTAGGNKIEFFTFNEAFYKNKNVLLFDDVRTSGTTYKQVLNKLLLTGALNVTGIFLAKTVNHF